MKDQQKSQKGQNAVIFTEEKAREYFESRRWPNGPVCPHCGSVNVVRLQGKSTRPGVLKCREPECRKQFTVTVGTVMEDSHLKLSQWAMAFHLMVSSKKGISALQLQRNLGLGSYKTAWHLAHRIREAMRAEPLSGKLKGAVQVDECYIGASRIGKKKDPSKARKPGRGTEKAPVVVLVETDGNAIAHPIGKATIKELGASMQANVDPSETIVTDEWPAYRKASAGFAGHEKVLHSMDEYVNANGYTTNTAESFFGLLKRGIHGTFHHVSKEHLHRYCDEFSFRWNGRKLSDTQRRDAAVQDAEGKRLRYKSPASKPN